MNRQDKAITRYPKERNDGIIAVSDRLEKEALTLPTEDEKKRLSIAVTALKVISPGPRVSRMLGEFLIDLANEQDRQDKKYGSDSNDRSQLVIDP